jgi:hypothetical protein
MRLSRSFAATALSLSLTALALPGSAQADRWHGNRYWYGHNNGAAAVFGLATGLIIGGALAAPYNRGYYYDRPYYYGRPYYGRPYYAPGYYAPPPVVYAPPPVYYSYPGPYRYYNGGYYGDELGYGD